MTDTQAIYALTSDGYTPQILLNWIKRHGYKPIKRVHYVGKSIRYRIKEPSTDKKYYTIVLPNRIHIVLEK